MTVYLDTSIVLRVVFAQADPLAIWGKWDAACASELLGVEARRILDRLRLEGALDDEQVGAFHAALAAIERTIDRIRLTRLVLGRSEEHTSELQSRSDLVCRLLLEKKKNCHSWYHTDIALLAPILIAVY